MAGHSLLSCSLPIRGWMTVRLWKPSRPNAMLYLLSLPPRMHKEHRDGGVIGRCRCTPGAANRPCAAHSANRATGCRGAVRPSPSCDRRSDLVRLGRPLGDIPRGHKGKRGKTPVVSSTGARFGVNLISAVSAQGQLRFMLTKGRVTAAVFMDFLKRLLVNARKPIFVVVDGHPTHRAKSVARFVAAHAGKLALFFLPPYSPELNPDELVWNDLKNRGTGRKLITSLAQLRQTVVSHMRQLQKLPDLVRSFFHAPTTRYARA